MRLIDWIEYMEGEGDPEKMSQLSMLLKHSIADQVVLDNLRRLRRMIKCADPADDVMDKVSNAEFLESMHLKIMEQITVPEKKRARAASESQLRTDEDSDSSLDSCKS